MGADPRLPKMPEKPTLIDFFKRVSPRPICCKAHGTRKGGHPEKVVLACLLHDIGVASSSAAITAIGARR